jgi:hypothetical protein
VQITQDLTVLGRSYPDVKKELRPLSRITGDDPRATKPTATKKKGKTL